MKELIIGGIYLTKNDNYLVVVKKDLFNYRIAHFSGLNFTQEDLLKQKTLSVAPYEQYPYERYYIKKNEEYISNYFSNGYCGKVTGKFLQALIDKFREEELEFDDPDTYELYLKESAIWL